MTVYIHSSIKDEVVEVLNEVDEEKEEEKPQQWEQEFNYSYCPECGDSFYIKGYECENCGFPHKNDHLDLLEKDFLSDFLDFPDDDYFYPSFYD